MDIVIVLMLTVTLLSLFILSWLPKIGVNSQIVFSVFGLGFAFIMALLISNVTITDIAPYPETQNITVTATTINLPPGSAAYTTTTINEPAGGVNYYPDNQTVTGGAPPYPDNQTVTATTSIVSSPVTWVTYALPYTWMLTLLYYGLGIALLLRFVGLTFIAMGKTINPGDDED